jgi:redox-sensitive bicupin YhaK (pirin superfamily)
MITKIPAESRGLTQFEWLRSHHSFSFGEYYDPEKMGFGTLRVLNDDIVEGGGGFPLHFHDNMEIVTIVLKGALEHKDSTGGHGTLKAGQMQRMTAGSGIQHSEYNASKTEPVHFLQIWIMPKMSDLAPEYEQKEFASVLKPNQFSLIVDPEKKDTALFIHQDVRFYLGRLEKESVTEFTSSSPKHGIYAFLIEGEVQLEEETLKAGDAVTIMHLKQFQAKALKPSLLLVIETLH